MKKRDWLWVALGFVLTWGIDQVTKQWALDIRGIQAYGPLHFVLHFNPGAILGTFSDLPPVLRIVTLSTGGAFLIFTFAIFQYLIPTRALILRVGMAILLGGIIGNVTDRILSGRIVDFIVIKVGTIFSPAFNVADALQWVGYFMVLFQLIRDGKELWPMNNQRKSFWINPSYQLRYSLKITVFGLCFALIAGTLSFTYLKVTIAEISRQFGATTDGHFLLPFALTFAAVSVIFCALLFFIGLILSHRSAGPIYAFELFLNDLLEGKERKLRLRQGDEFRHLEQLADKVLEELPILQRRREP